MINRKILITGGNGQLGKEIATRTAPNHTFIPLGKDELDITCQREVEKKVNELKPTHIIHAGALTAVDQCELEQQKAFEVNAIGSFHLANAARAVCANMLYISSDYVFDGTNHHPYEEGDQPSPSSTYGMSKWLGERLVKSALPSSTIIRTSWVYGHGGRNFVNTMLRLAAQQKEIKVVSDQIGCPTYTADLADVILQLIDKKGGMYHVSNSGSCSWYEFAKRILVEAGYDPSIIHPISTEDFGAVAPRPAYSVLSHSNLIAEGVTPPRHWAEALKEYLVKERTK